ncbi:MULTISPECIES: type 1 glutamine amidotransferase domain-containing protein [Methanobacterium]|uniref:General stress protein n=1 Tax=Methanobacterium bryantii TaxID=2161 RepID=A0A2A2H848_METBR|nr:MULTISPECIES: type 1 glutamine amidotransferase domain-containing protein [Methanobacterium]OEC84375.1 protease [Methanobacterium sp. A39]PAV05631.1 general stress protein [Methanobacterium bryantii]
MSKIGVLIGPKFEDIEYTKPSKSFKEKGHELTHIGLKRGQTVGGKEEKTKVIVDKSAGDVSVNDFDAIFIPGGCSPDKLREDENVVEFVKEFVESDKPVFAICHAPQLLITAQVIEGRKVAGWKSIVQDIKNAGAEYVNREVVEDGNIISSRGPDDIPAFTEAALKKLE